MHRQLSPRSAPGRPLTRFAITFALSAFAFWLVIVLLPGIHTERWQAVIIAQAVIAGFNALIWPLVVRLATPVLVWTAGLANLALNGVAVWLAGQVVPGLRVDSFGWATFAAFAVTATATIVSTILAIDDEDMWRRHTLRRLVNRRSDVVASDVPGTIFVQIDGLSATVARRAMADGYLPTLAHLIRSGSHEIFEWECDLSSQTGASQAGILLGDNHNMPAFRWYEKDLGRVLTTNRPKDAATIEERQSTGQGLLVDDGVSRANVFSGDSPDSLFTFSTITTDSRSISSGLRYFLADPYAITRTLVLSIADMWRETAAAHRAKRRGRTPRLRRGGIYPLLRAGTTVMLRDLTVNTLMADIYRSVPSAYVDFVGYDEVAHHSGVGAHDALEVLYRLDQQFARLQRAIDDAPRPYNLVFLSDHGQSQGATFSQRFGESLSDVVNELIEGNVEIAQPQMPTEGWGNLNGVLNEAIRDPDSKTSSVLRFLLRSRTNDGEVMLGASGDDLGNYDAKSEEAPDVVVLASGNLGLISFPDMPGRVTLESLTDRYPDLIPGLANHPGVGFLVIDSTEFGAVAIGANGVCHLDDGAVEGVDPLAPFGPNTLHHVRRTSSFDNAPDLLINGFHDAQLDEGAAFEELIGYHGGLGGDQARPFVLHPTCYEAPTEPIVGASSIHKLFASWLSASAVPRGETNEQARSSS